VIPLVLISDDWAEWTCQEGVEFLHALQQVRKVRGIYSGPSTWRSSDVFLHHPRSSAALLYPPCSKLSQTVYSLPYEELPPLYKVKSLIGLSFVMLLLVWSWSVLLGRLAIDSVKPPIERSYLSNWFLIFSKNPYASFKVKTYKMTLHILYMCQDCFLNHALWSFPLVGYKQQYTGCYWTL
jgi:hypothetical protein